MEKGISIEQALKNIEIVVVDHFKGTRADHIALEQSLIIIKAKIDACKTCHQPGDCPTAKCDEDTKCVMHENCEGEPRTQDKAPEAGC